MLSDQLTSGRPDDVSLSGTLNICSNHTCHLQPTNCPQKVPIESHKVCPPVLIGSHLILPSVRAVLCDTSRILENLSSTAGVQSFVLAVDPTEPSDGGFLGGSVVGREFWRGLRGGGEHGAKAFKAHCNAHLQNTVTDRGTSQPPTAGRRFSTPSLSNAASAKSIKNELYEGARSALR